MCYKCAECGAPMKVDADGESDFFIVIDDEFANFCGEQCKEMYLSELHGFNIIDDVFVEQLPSDTRRFDVC